MNQLSAAAFGSPFVLKDREDENNVNLAGK